MKRLISIALFALAIGAGSYVKAACTPPPSNWHLIVEQTTESGDMLYLHFIYQEGTFDIVYNKRTGECHSYVNR
jgi:hypothetical protein